MEITARRRARSAGILLGTAILLGLLYGLLLVAFGRPGFLFTWWGTCLRALAAVLLCFAIAGTIDRRWARGSAGSGEREPGAVAAQPAATEVRE